MNSRLDKDSYKIYIVDNDSHDNSLEGVRGLKDVSIIQSGKNIGFGRACNLVLKNFSSQYVLLLNPDVIVQPDSLSRTIDFLNNNPNVDIVGVKNLNMNGGVAKSCARFPSTLRLINDILGLSKILPKIFIPGTIMMDWDHLSSREVDHVIGAYMMIRYPTIKEINFFDEDFFLYMEDVDLSYRIKKEGGTIYYNASIGIIHEGGGTTKSIKALSLFYSLQSRIIYCKKHFNLFSLWVVIILSSTLEPFIRLLQLSVKLQFNKIHSIFEAYCKYYKWLVTGNLLKSGL